MAKSDGAVADIDGLQEAARNMVEEVGCPFEERVFPYRLLKAISTARTVKVELQTRAAEILAQLSATEGAAEEAHDLMRNSAAVSILPVVDSAGCSRFEFEGLAVAAYVAARSQALRFIIVDGEQLMLSSDGDADPDTEEGRKLCFAAAAEFVTNVCEFASNLDTGVGGGGRGGQVRAMEALARLRTNTLAALSAHRQHCEEASRSSADVLYVTVNGFGALDPTEFRAMVDDLQQSVPKGTERGELSGPVSASMPCARVEDVSASEAPPTSLRSLLLHRVKQTCGLGLGESIPLVLRGAGDLPSRRCDITLDLALVMDLTGSMGSWMEAAKQHLTSIVESLRTDTGIGAIRVSFVGYRDFGDNGRCVKHDFVPIARADETVIPLMRAQRPSGEGIDRRMC
jgi:hypothetical protein